MRSALTSGVCKLVSLSGGDSTLYGAKDAMKLTDWPILTGELEGIGRVPDLCQDYKFDRADGWQLLICETSVGNMPCCMRKRRAREWTRRVWPFIPINGESANESEPFVIGRQIGGRTSENPQIESQSPPANEC